MPESEPLATGHWAIPAGAPLGSGSRPAWSSADAFPVAVYGAATPLGAWSRVCLWPGPCDAQGPPRPPCGRASGWRRPRSEASRGPRRKGPLQTGFGWVSGAGGGPGLLLGCACQTPISRIRVRRSLAFLPACEGPDHSPPAPPVGPGSGGCVPRPGSPGVRGPQPPSRGSGKRGVWTAGPVRGLGPACCHQDAGWPGVTSCWGCWGGAGAAEVSPSQAAGLTLRSGSLSLLKLRAFGLTVACRSPVDIRGHSDVLAEVTPQPALGQAHPSAADQGDPEPGGPGRPGEEAAGSASRWS